MDFNLPDIGPAVTGKVIAAGETHRVGDKFDFTTIKDAALADEVEHKQTLRQAFATHKKAIFWSMALSGGSHPS